MCDCKQAEPKSPFEEFIDSDLKEVHFILLDGCSLKAITLCFGNGKSFHLEVKLRNDEYGIVPRMILEKGSWGRTKAAEEVHHNSDCSVYNAPAYPPDKCDCGIEFTLEDVDFVNEKVKSVLERFFFEPNDESTRAQIREDILNCLSHFPELSNIVVVCGGTNNANVDVVGARIKVAYVFDYKGKTRCFKATIERRMVELSEIAIRLMPGGKQERKVGGDTEVIDENNKFGKVLDKVDGADQD